MILVTGPTGKVGQALIDALKAKGASFKALARSDASARTLEAKGVAVVRGDLSDLGPALKGVDTLFLLSSSPDPYPQEAPAIAAAKAAGVKRIVKLSALGASADSANGFFRGHARVERLIEESGLEWTSLRPSFFMQNWIVYNANAVKAGQPVYGNTGEGRMGIIDTRDIAAVAAVALTEDGHQGRVYELTGPEPLSNAEAAAKLSKVLGREVAFVPVPDQGAYQAMLGMGMPADYAWSLTTLNQAVRKGAADVATQTVELVTGKAPRTLDAFFQEHADAFRG
ncbi:MAG TPA: SDR family oxidoreductase [Holophagaceae bacterium]|nr:SDR family oxidoreductase [Holophagaceae bacterium]